MSSFLDKIPADVAKLALEVAEKLATAAWHAIRGEPTDGDAAAIKAIARRSLLEQLGAAEREAKALRDGIELGIALEKLATGAGAMGAAIAAAEKAGFDRMAAAAERVELEMVREDGLP